MKKFFIPTSSLNVIEILLSEAISPANFYKRFETVAPNNNQEKILLYSKYPKFEIHDEERENNPIVIELTVNNDIHNNFSKENSPFKDVEIYSYNDTIELADCDGFYFYFQDNDKKSSAKTACNNDIGFKYKDIEKHFKLDSDIDDNYKFEWSKIYMDKKDIEEIIKRLKGFILGYTFGANIKDTITEDDFLEELTPYSNQQIKNDKKDVSKSDEYYKKIIEECKKEDKDKDKNEIKYNNKDISLNKDGKLQIKNIENELLDFYINLIYTYIYKDFDNILKHYVNMDNVNEFYSKDDNTKCDSINFGIAIIQVIDKINNKNHNDDLSYLQQLTNAIKNDDKFDYFNSDNEIIRGYAIFCKTLDKSGIEEVKKDLIQEWCKTYKKIVPNMNNDTSREKLKDKLLEDLINSYKYTFGILGAKIGYRNFPQTVVSFTESFFPKGYIKNFRDILNNMNMGSNNTNKNQKNKRPENNTKDKKQDNSSQPDIHNFIDTQNDSNEDVNQPNQD